MPIDRVGQATTTRTMPSNLKTSGTSKLSDHSYKPLTAIRVVVICCACWVGIGRPAEARGQVLEVLFDSSDMTQVLISSMVRVTDGGYVFTHGGRQYKIDANGQLVWSQQCTLGIQEVSAMPDGGTVALTTLTLSEPISGSLDSLVFGLRLVRRDVGGGLLWGKLITVPIIGTNDFADIYSNVRMATDSAGRIFVTIGYTGFEPRQESITCVDASGALLWSKVLTGFTTAHTLYNHVAPDGSGGCFVVWGHNATDPFSYDASFDLAHLQASGSLEWCVLGPMDHDFQVRSMISVNGVALIGGIGDVGGLQHRGFIIKVGPDGALKWSKLYRSQGAIENHGGWELGALASGELIASYFIPHAQYYNPVIMHTDTNGTVLNSARALPVTEGGFTYHVDWEAVDVRDSVITMAVWLYDQPAWDLSVRAAGLWVLSPDLNGCMLSPVYVNSPAANPWVTLTLGTTTQTDAPVNVIDSATTTVPVGSFTTADLCSVVNHVPENPAPAAEFQVLGNVVEQGTMIAARSDREGTIVVFNASGKCIARSQMHAGSNLLPTTSWPTGLYVLRATDASGGMVGCVRAIVE